VVFRVCGCWFLYRLYSAPVLTGISGGEWAGNQPHFTAGFGPVSSRKTAPSHIDWFFCLGSLFVPLGELQGSVLDVKASCPYRRDRAAGAPMKMVTRTEGMLGRTRARIRAAPRFGANIPNGSTGIRRLVVVVSATMGVRGEDKVTRALHSRFDRRPVRHDLHAILKRATWPGMTCLDWRGWD
jgi:hypothetical protein